MAVFDALEDHGRFGLVGDHAPQIAGQIPVESTEVRVGECGRVVRLHFKG